MCIITSVVHKMRQEREVKNLTNTELLEKKIRESGKKKGYLAEKCGLSRAGFRNCETNKANFTADHIQIWCDELDIVSLREKEAIFFAKTGA